MYEYTFNGKVVTFESEEVARNSHAMAEKNLWNVVTPVIKTSDLWIEEKQPDTRSDAAKALAAFFNMFD